MDQLHLFQSAALIVELHFRDPHPGLKVRGGRVVVTAVSADRGLPGGPLKTRFPLPADADLGRLIALEQERAFMEDSALERARPDAPIDLTRPYGYPQLLEQVKVHGYNLMQESGELVSPEEVAVVPERGGVSIEDAVREAKHALRRRKPSRAREAADKLKRAASRPVKAVSPPPRRGR